MSRSTKQNIQEVLILFLLNSKENSGNFFSLKHWNDIIGSKVRDCIFITFLIYDTYYVLITPYYLLSSIINIAAEY